MDAESYLALLCGQLRERERETRIAKKEESNWLLAAVLKISWCGNMQEPRLPRTYSFGGWAGRSAERSPRRRSSGTTAPAEGAAGPWERSEQLKKPRGPWPV